MLGLGLATLRLNFLDQRSQHPLYRNYSLLRNPEIGFSQKSQSCASSKADIRSRLPNHVAI